MRKIIILLLCVFLVFAAISCKEPEPEPPVSSSDQSSSSDKKDAIEQASANIPAPTVDMTKAKPITEAEKEAFLADYEKGGEQVQSGLIMAITSGEVDSVADAINYYLNAVNSVKSRETEPNYSVTLADLSGSMSVKSNSAIVVDGKNVTNLSATLTLAKTSATAVISGKYDGKDFKVTIPFVIDSSEGIDVDVDSKNIKFEGAAEELMGKIGDVSLETIKDFTATVEMKNVIAKLNVQVSGVKDAIAVTVSANESATITVTESAISINVASASASVNAAPFGSVGASIKGVVFVVERDLKDYYLESVSEATLTAELLPYMDNIRASVKLTGLTMGKTFGIDSIEAVVLGYENISAAAKVSNFQVSEKNKITFNLGASFAFESQAIGLNADIAFEMPISSIQDIDMTNKVTVLNGKAVDPESLMTLISEVGM